MANESSECVEKSISDLKSCVRKSFGRLYAALKARELKTLRQLEAIRKQCESNEDFFQNCVQSIRISYDSESTILSNISNYGVIDLEKLNFEGNIFVIEDYICPKDDHMYSYKCIDELTKKESCSLESTIEEAALNQITSEELCVCNVKIAAEEVSKQFREEPECLPHKNDNLSISNNCCNSPSKTSNDDLKLAEVEDVEEVRKINPTEEWLNSIKSQTETEPSQVTDVMEHSQIGCS